jgi:hypothetical protein
MQDGNPFFPTQFIVRSRENTSACGVPISMGLIFVAYSIDYLQYTKHFSRMSEKEIS